MVSIIYVAYLRCYVSCTGLLYVLNTQDNNTLQYKCHGIQRSLESKKSL